MRKYPFFYMNSFSCVPGYGNPAAVVYGAENISETDMQKIAKINGLSETAFIINEKTSGYDYRIKFFTPEKPINMCGHASIAAAYAYSEMNDMPCEISLTQKTDVGTLKIKVERLNEYSRVSLQMDTPDIERTFHSQYKEFAQALGLKEEEIENDLPVAVNKKGYLYIPIKTIDSARRIKTNKELMLDMDKKLNLHGWYVFTPQVLLAENDFHVRFFAPSMGVDEDPVTGTANAYFSFYYYRYISAKPSGHLKNEQGFEIGKNGEIEVEFSELDALPSIVISGYVQKYIKGELNIQNLDMYSN